MFSMTIFGVQAPDSGNMELLAHGATDAQKERWLLPNLRGEISSAFALTEPFLAGADPTVIGTTAASSTATSGSSTGTSGSSRTRRCADIILVFAETNPESRPHRHASIFVVPAGTPGMEIVRDIPTMAHPDPEYGDPGNHAEIDVPRLPRARRPSHRAPGRRLRARAAAARRRPHPPRDALARSGAALARHHVRARGVAHVARQAARPAPDGAGLHRAVAHRDPGGAAADVPDRVEDGQVRRGAVRADLGMVKAHVSKIVLAVLDRTIQVCGALGYSSDLPVEAWYRSTRFGPIGDGPDELHKSVLARTVLKDYRAGRRAGRPSTSRAAVRPRSRSGPSCAPRPVSPRRQRSS